MSLLYLGRWLVKSLVMNSSMVTGAPVASPACVKDAVAARGDRLMNGVLGR